MWATEIEDAVHQTQTSAQLLVVDMHVQIAHDINLWHNFIITVKDVWFVIARISIEMLVLTLGNKIWFDENNQ